MGPTLGIRLMNTSGRALTFVTNTVYMTQRKRAKELMTSFIQKCVMIVEFKEWTYDFLTNIYRINGHMQNRLKSHDLKKKALDNFFEAELRNLKIYAFKQSKINKEFMTLAVNLSTIRDVHKKALINEYFSLYKLVYRIRSIVAYYWDGDEDALH